MEGPRQFQDRLLRDTSRRVGWAYARRLRRSGDHSQVLFDASCFCIRGATRHYGRGSRPRRTRGNCLARWTETQLTVGTIASHSSLMSAGAGSDNGYPHRSARYGTAPQRGPTDWNGTAPTARCRQEPIRQAELVRRVVPCTGAERLDRQAGTNRADRPPVGGLREALSSRDGDAGREPTAQAACGHVEGDQLLRRLLLRRRGPLPSFRATGAPQGPRGPPRLSRRCRSCRLTTAAADGPAGGSVADVTRPPCGRCGGVQLCGRRLVPAAEAGLVRATRKARAHDPSDGPSRSSAPAARHLARVRGNRTRDARTGGCLHVPAPGYLTRHHALVAVGCSWSSERRRPGLRVLSGPDGVPRAAGRAVPGSGAARGPGHGAPTRTVGTPDRLVGRGRRRSHVGG